jgi:eukaryotic-like serine/threonine-protein kinase
VLSATKRDAAGDLPTETTRFDPVPGTVVDGKYRVEKILGEGGMGLVVAAINLGLEQEVAIKFLLPSAMRNKIAVERFLREAKVAAKVRSDYVARVFDVGTTEEGGVPYIVMEHLEGCDLGKLIDREGALPMDEACEMALQACEALAEVHAAGIVHRDLKPSNLFVTRRADGSPAVKLLDFGISKLTFGGDDGVDPALTQTATIMGSPSYMSPEQLKSTKEVDHRADVWSLGAVLYEAITGKPAFRGESLPQVCAMIASEDPALPSSRREGIPMDIERVLLGALEKNPDKRTTLAELARAMAKYAPDRAKASLERIEATIGGEHRPRALTYADRSRADDAPSVTRARLRGESQPTVGEGNLPVSGPSGEPEASRAPVAAGAGAPSGRTISSWGDQRRSRRGGSGAVLLLLVASGIAAFAVYTGRIEMKKLRGDLAGASSAVTSVASSAASVASSAAGEVSSAVSEVSSTVSAVASALPPLPSLPIEEPSASGAASASAAPAPSGSAAAPEDEDGEDEPEENGQPAASASGHAPGAAPAAAAKHATPSKAHGKSKKKTKKKHTP